MIKVTIYYRGNFRKARIFDTEEELQWYMQRYGLDLEKDFRTGKRNNNPDAWYWFFIPFKRKIYGIDEDDRELEIEEILIEPWSLMAPEEVVNKYALI